MSAVPGPRAPGSGLLAPRAGPSEASSQSGERVRPRPTGTRVPALLVWHLPPRAGLAGALACHGQRETPPRARPRASAFLPAVPSDVFFINSVWKGYYEYLGKRQPATLTVDWFNATSSKVNATFTEGPRVELKLTGRSRALQARPPRARRGERVLGAWAPRGCVSARADNCATRHVLIPKVTKQNQHEKAS